MSATPTIRIGASTIHIGDALTVLRSLPAASVHCCVTSPPYWGLRSYLPEGHRDKALEIGLEPDWRAYLATMVAVFSEIRRVLRPDATAWVNLGDSYATGAGRAGDCPGGGEQGEQWKGYRGGHTVANSGKEARRIATMGPMTQPNRLPQPGLKPKDLVGMPWRIALALQEDGWWLRSDVVWHKANPLPESVTDRPSKSHEYLFMLTKSERYFYDSVAVQEPASGRAPGNVHRHKHDDGTARNRTKAGLTAIGAVTARNCQSVWTIPTAGFPGPHFATMPAALAQRCIRAGTSEAGCCPACGAPWARVVETTYENPGNRHTNGLRSLTNRAITAGFAQRLEKRTVTTGWQPSCGCSAGDPVPCIVIDPFFGAGTTGLVAERLGRRFVGVELNPDYAAMAAERIRSDAPLLHAAEPLDAATDPSADLFAGEI